MLTFHTFFLLSSLLKFPIVLRCVALFPKISYPLLLLYFLWISTPLFIGTAMSCPNELGPVSVVRIELSLSLRRIPLSPLHSLTALLPGLNTVGSSLSSPLVGQSSHSRIGLIAGGGATAFRQGLHPATRNRYRDPGCCAGIATAFQAALSSPIHSLSPL